MVHLGSTNPNCALREGHIDCAPLSDGMDCALQKPNLHYAVQISTLKGLCLGRAPLEWAKMNSALTLGTSIVAYFLSALRQECTTPPNPTKDSKSVPR